MSTNTTCHMKEATQSPPPLIQNGKVVIQAHHIGWAVTGFFALASTVVSAWLINKHLQWYTNKREQRYIVRILFMVPIYSIVSFASYLFWNQSTPLLLLRDCYEATVLTSFFYLLLMYLSPNPVEQKDIFRKVGLSKENDRGALRRGEPVKKWMFPLAFVTSKPGDGLYFLQIMKWAILQYCVIRPLTTLAAVILNYVGLYCESSWSPGWGYVYITVIVSISVSVAMYCLIQVYVPVSSFLAPHRPLLKLFSVKAVVFLTFWQATFLSLLATFGLVKDTKYMTAEDINIGIGAILETVEMTFFAFLHIKAFSYKPYCPVESASAKGYPLHLERTPRLRSLGHALDFRETLREVWSGCVYIIRRFRGQETDLGARRLAAREEVFGGREWRKGPPRNFDEELARATEKRALDPELQGLKIVVDVNQEVHVEDELQWLGLGDDHAYGLGFSRRERSVGLEEQIQLELERRGLPRIMREKSRAKVNSRGLPEDSRLLLPEGSREIRHGKQRSWWRNAYDRISGTSRDDHSDNGLHENADLDSGMARKPSRRVSFKTKLPLDREIGEVDTYARLPTVESYDGVLSPSRTHGHERSERQPRTASNSYRPPNALHMSMGPLTPGDGDQQLPFDLRPPKHKPIERNAEGQIYSRQPDLRLSPNADHVLSRLFPSSPSKSDAGTSTTASIALSTNPSSQTHSDSDRRYLRLVPPAQIVSKDTIALRTPVVVHEESHTHLRVEDTWRKRERSRSAMVEGIDSEPIPRHELSSPREETRMDREGPSASLSTPAALNSAPLAREFSDSLHQHEFGPRGPRVPRSKIVLPAPLALDSMPKDRAQHDVTIAKTSTNTSPLPESRFSLAPPAKRKAVPQYHETNLPMTANNEPPETQANSLVHLALSANSLSSIAEIRPSERVETTASDPRLPSSYFAPSPIVPDASLQRRGARAVRRSSAPLPPHASTVLKNLSSRPLILGSAADVQRARRSKQRSPRHFNFPRHNVTGHPIAEETFEVNSLRNRDAQRMSDPVRSSPSQSRRITSSQHIRTVNDAHDLHDLMTYTNFDQTV